FPLIEARHIGIRRQPPPFATKPSGCWACEVASRFFAFSTPQLSRRRLPHLTSIFQSRRCGKLMGGGAQIPTSLMSVIDRPHRRSMEVRLTRRWRKADSNSWSRFEKAVLPRRATGVASRSAGGREQSHDPAIERGLDEQVFFERARGDCSAECLALVIVFR